MFNPPRGYSYALSTSARAEDGQQQADDGRADPADDVPHRCIRVASLESVAELIGGGVGRIYPDDQDNYADDQKNDSDNSLWAHLVFVSSGLEQRLCLAAEWTFSTSRDNTIFRHATEGRARRQDVAL